jgi:hypothetical protein
MAMKNQGWHVDVITQADFGRYYPFDSDDTWASVRESIINIYGVRDRGILSKLCFIDADRLRPLVWSVKAAVKGIRLARSRKYDYIFSRVAPLYGHLPALLVSFFIKLPWIANWSDPMPSIKAPAPYGNGPGAKISFLMDKYCNTVIKRASWHTFPCKRLREYFRLCFDGFEMKSSVVPHVALRKFSSTVVPMADSFTLFHMGHMTGRDPGVFLGGIRRFLDRRKAVGMRISFLGEPSENVRRCAEALNLTEFISYTDFLTYTEAQTMAARAAILVVIEASCEEGIFLPSKFIDFVQTGRPILAVSPREGTLNDILSLGGGIVADALSVQSVADAVDKFYAAWEAGELETKLGSWRLYDMFDEEKVIAAFYRDIQCIQ